VKPLGTTQAVEIRDATVSDAVQVARLMTELGYPATELQAAHRLDHFAQDPASRVVVAHSGGEILGVIATHMVPRLDQDVLSCRVTDIVVAERARRRGVGRALLAAAEAEGRRWGAGRLDLSSANWRDAAHAFYAALGFESSSTSFVKLLD
jgi:GNAT superfamily N-acetyltransferase